METLTGKPLQPLNSGMVLIVGAKVSNFSEEITTNPRVVIWDSQNEHWTSKEIPTNVRVIFMTRFVSHSTTEKLLTEARKRQLTIFNVEGTGIIVKQVRELLNMTPPNGPTFGISKPVEVKDKREKLSPLFPFIDFSKTNTDNARSLMVKAKELGIETTEGSLSNTVANQRKKLNQTGVPKSIQSKVDISVEILDSAIKELQDVRAFLIETVAENTRLRNKLDKFKKAMEE